MGKTKTAFVSETDKKELSGAEKYKQKQEKKAEAEKVEKVRVPGLSGGQRVTAISAEPLVDATEEKAEEKAIKRGPKVRGKKYREQKNKIDIAKLYPLTKAIELVKETSYSKFDGTVELHLVVKKEGSSANVTLPHSSGKKKNIEVANEKTLEKLKKGNIDFDILLSTADMMPKLVPFAKILGPKGLMPNPKNGTIIKSAKDADKFSGNSVVIKTEKKQPVIHTTVGKVSQNTKELEENVTAVFNALDKKQILKAYIKSTMSPSIKLTV